MVAGPAITSRLSAPVSARLQVDGPRAINASFRRLAGPVVGCAATSVSSYEPLKTLTGACPGEEECSLAPVLRSTVSVGTAHPLSPSPSASLPGVLDGAALWIARSSRAMTKKTGINQTFSRLYNGTIRRVGGAGARS